MRFSICLFTLFLFYFVSFSQINYDVDIQPIFNNHCIACHSGNSPSAGLDLTTFDDVLAGGDDGVVIIEGDSENSLLWQVVSSGDMPNNFANNNMGIDDLNQTQVDLISQWIDEFGVVFGCTDELAVNYNPEATDDDGSCEYLSIQGLWELQGTYINITDDVLMVFDELGPLNCFGLVEYAYEQLEGTVIIISDPYYGYDFEVEMFVDENGLNILLPYEEENEIWLPSSLSISDLTSSLCSAVDYEQMIGQWLLWTVDDVPTAKNELHYIEIFGDGTTIRYDYDFENDCYEISQMEVYFLNAFGQAILNYENDIEGDAIIIIDENGNLVTFLDANGENIINDQTEIWVSTTFNPDLFINNECGNSGVSDVDYFDALIFPNPSKEHLFIELSHHGDFILELMNIDGKKIFSTEFYDKCEIDVSSLSKGIYVAHIFDKQKSIIKTVYIE